MADLEKLRELLANVSVDEISVDENGRVVINDAALLAGLREIGSQGNARMTASDNYGCCKNGIACKPVAVEDVAEMRSRFIRKG